MSTEDKHMGGNRPLDIKALNKSFGENHVLRDLDLQVDKGESVVILGKSGCGKSVLNKCIIGLMLPDGGELKVLGHDVMGTDQAGMEEIRQQIGYLFQGGALYDSMSVRKNLRFPLKRNQPGMDEDELEDRVRQTLSQVGLEQAIDKFPSELSGGMKKRVALARTLMRKPRLIIYDEPTTGLDPVTSKEISQLINKIKEEYNTTSLIITHDMPCAKTTSDRVMILDQGSFIAKGSYQELESSREEKVQAFFH